MRQTYPLQLQRMVHDLYRREGKRTYGLVRGSNAGASRFPFVLYSDYYSHAGFLTALVNSSLAGVLWTPEVRSSKTGEEWLRRMQLSCLSPVAMVNAWADGTKPWSFPEVFPAVREAAIAPEPSASVSVHSVRPIPARWHTALPRNGAGAGVCTRSGCDGRLCGRRATGDHEPVYDGGVHSGRTHVRGREAANRSCFPRGNGTTSIPAHMRARRRRSPSRRVWTRSRCS